MIETSARNNKLTEQFALVFVALISIAIRLNINFSTEFIPGGNGAYYLIQIRSILENGKLLLPDFPLLFWIESGIAFIIIKLGLANFNSAIDIASRLFDSIVPVLSIIPAYLLVKKILNQNESKIATIIFSSFSVLYYSFLVLISEYQKNSLGILWLFWLLYFMICIHEKATVKNILSAFLLLILTALTHYGCIAVGLTIILVDLVCRYFFKYSFKRFIKIFVLLVITIFISLGLMYLINPWRAKTLLKVPSEIFRNPIIFSVFSKHPLITPIDLAGIIFLNITAITSLYLFVKNFTSINHNIRSFILSLIILVLFLASPFLDAEFAQRVYFISYLVALPLLAVIHNYFKEKKQKSILLATIAIVVIISSLIMMTRPNYSNMNKNLYAELQLIRNRANIDSTSVIIARHGMEYWSIWIMRCDAYRQESVWPIYWKWYKDVYVLRQKKNKSPFGFAGIYGEPFSEPELPENSYLVYSSECFDLFKAPNPPEDYKKYNKTNER